MKTNFTQRILAVAAMAFTVTFCFGQDVVHTVKRGESLSIIAKKYDITVDDLKQANPKLGKALYVGAKLVIPPKNAEATGTDTPETPEETLSTPDESTKAQNELNTGSPVEIVTNTGTATPINSDSEEESNNFGSINLGWEPGSMLPEGGDDKTLTGFYLKAGGYQFWKSGFGFGYFFGIKYANSSEDSHGAKSEINLWSGILDIRAAWKFQIPNSQVYVIPYIGIEEGILLSAKQKIEYNGESKTLNLKDEDDVGSYDATWKQPLIWKVGADIKIDKNWGVSLGYGHHIGNSSWDGLTKNVGYKFFSLGLSYYF